MIKKIYEFLTTKYIDAYCKAILPVYIFLRVFRFVQFAQENATIASVLSLLRHICLVLVVIGFVANILKNKNISIGNFAIIIVGLLGYLILKDNTNSYIYVVGIILESIRNRDKKPIFKSIFILYSLLFCLNVLLVETGLVVEWHENELGFIHYTDACAIFFDIIAAYYFTRDGKLDYRDLIVIVASVILFYVTEGRNTLLSTIILILLALLNTLIKGKLKDKLKYIFIPLPFILLFLSLYLTSLYHDGTSIGIKLNELFTDRLWLNDRALNDHGPYLWGDHINENGLGNPYDFSDLYFYIDCGYISLLLHAGIIIMAVILLIFSASLYNLAKTNNYSGLIILVVFLMFYFMETYLFTPERNIAVLLLAENFNFNISLDKVFNYASKKLA